MKKIRFNRHTLVLLVILMMVIILRFFIMDRDDSGHKQEIIIADPKVEIKHE